MFLRLPLGSLTHSLRTCEELDVEEVACALEDDDEFELGFSCGLLTSASGGQPILLYFWLSSFIF
jgi:hypothetical protein